MRVIARHSARIYDIAIVRFENSPFYRVVTTEEGMEITGQEVSFDRTTSLVLARQSANLLWLRGMGRDPMTERVLVDA